jgi:hypothetical protein
MFFCVLATRSGLPSLLQNVMLAGSRAFAGPLPATIGATRRAAAAEPRICEDRLIGSRADTVVRRLLTDAVFI